jgi:hypothetical protein
MRAIAIALLLTLPGCAHASLPKAVGDASKALGDLGKAATVAATLHRKGAETVIGICRAQLGADATADDRDACVTRYGYSPEAVRAFEAAIAKAAEIAAAAEAVLDELRAAQPMIDAALEAAEAVKEGAQ